MAYGLNNLAAGLPPSWWAMQNPQPPAFGLGQIATPLGPQVNYGGGIDPGGIPYTFNSLGSSGPPQPNVHFDSNGNYLPGGLPGWKTNAVLPGGGGAGTISYQDWMNQNLAAGYTGDPQKLTDSWNLAHSITDPSKLMAQPGIAAAPAWGGQPTAPTFSAAPTAPAAVAAPAAVQASAPLAPINFKTAASANLGQGSFGAQPITAAAAPAPSPINTAITRAAAPQQNVGFGSFGFGQDWSQQQQQRKPQRTT